MPGIQLCLMQRGQKFKEIIVISSTDFSRSERQKWVACLQHQKSSGLMQKQTFSSFWFLANVKIALLMMKNVRKISASGFVHAIMKVFQIVSFYRRFLALSTRIGKHKEHVLCKD
jgi:hypothetical protein